MVNSPMKTRALLPALALLALAACSSAPKVAEQKAPPAPAKPIGAIVEIKAPLGLPPVPIPTDNPPTADTIALGRKLTRMT